MAGNVGGSPGTSNRLHVQQFGHEVPLWSKRRYPPWWPAPPCMARNPLTSSNVPPPRPPFPQGTGAPGVSKDTQFIVPLLSNGPNNQVMQLKWALALARMLGR